MVPLGWLMEPGFKKECFAFHPSIWHMQVTIETDIGIFFLSPVVQLLKVEIDVKQVSMRLDDLGWTKLGHQTFWITSIKSIFPLTTWMPSQSGESGRSSESPS